jgi:hypothetical protein
LKVFEPAGRPIWSIAANHRFAFTGSWTRFEQLKLPDSSFVQDVPPSVERTTPQNCVPGVVSFPLPQFDWCVHARIRWEFVRSTAIAPIPTPVNGCSTPEGAAP